MTIPLRKIAFVAMPYGIRDVEQNGSSEPIEVDFDQLWDRAIFPALESIGYIPIRADKQLQRSSILKEMLDMLYHAELVLADVTAPSGNVYYEAGVRHGVRKKGSVLIAAEWADPLFNIAQIPQIRYPLTARPKQEDFDLVAETLRLSIPKQIHGLSPVSALVDTELASSEKLREVADGLHDFGIRLREAKQEAQLGNNFPLRILCEQKELENLPNYALLELLDAVRDYLDWGELTQLIGLLDDDLKSTKEVMERRALALSQQGDVSKAVSILQQLLETDEPSAELFGTLGSRFRELARQTKNAKKRMKYLRESIKSYQRGVNLDLNGFYCVSKLIVAYAQYDIQVGSDKCDERFSDQFNHATNILAAATNRARLLKSKNEWLGASELILSCVQGDKNRILESVETVLTHSWHDWKLYSLLQDLEVLNASSLTQDASLIAKIIETIEAELPISQKHLLELLEEKIRAEGFRCKKKTNVKARSAQPGEVVISITEDGEETTKTAKAGEMLIENSTTAAEQYLVNGEKFAQSYGLAERIENGWNVYEPIGERLAIKVDHSVSDQLDVDDMFYIVGYSKTRHIVRKNDYLLLNDIGECEIYRIACAEFWQTYEKVE